MAKEKELQGLLDSGLREPRIRVHPAAELRKHYRMDRETAEPCLAAVKLYVYGGPHVVERVI
jgi:hypothetical protein